MATTTKPDLSIQTTDHPNAVRMREAFDAFSRGDLDTVRQHLTDDCSWTNAGSSAISGTHRGWDAIAAMFGELLQRTGGTFAMKVHSTIADDRFAVAVYDATSTVKGVSATQRFVLIDEMTKDGKVKATQTLAYDQAAADQHFNR